MGLLVLILLVALATGITGTPAYVIARRTGSQNPWVAFIPLFGLWIVLLETTGQRGWIAVFAFIPLLSLILSLWLAFGVPVAHGRNRWWTGAFVVPGVNIIGYWCYAFTLPRDGSDTRFATAWM